MAEQSNMSDRSEIAAKENELEQLNFKMLKLETELQRYKNKMELSKKEIQEKEADMKYYMMKVKSLAPEGIVLKKKVIKAELALQDQKLIFDRYNKLMDDIESKWKNDDKRLVPVKNDRFNTMEYFNTLELIKRTDKIKAMMFQKGETAAELIFPKRYNK